MIELPWPPSILGFNGNQGKHWGEKGAARKKYKDQCAWMLLGKRSEVPPVPAKGNIHLKITFYPPTKHRFDIDGLLSRVKVGIDALAEFWQIDDYRFRPMTIYIGEVVKGGCVRIEIGENK